MSVTVTVWPQTAALNIRVRFYNGRDLEEQPKPLSGNIFFIAPKHTDTKLIFILRLFTSENFFRNDKIVSLKKLLFIYLRYAFSKIYYLITIVES